MDHKIKETFACVKASDDTVNAVLNIPAEQEAPRRFSHWQVVRRVAACAAMLALLIGAMVLPAPPASVTDPSGSTQVVPNSLFGIHVYADGGLVNLNSETEGPIFAGEENTEDEGNFGCRYSTDLLVYNATTGEWEKLIKEKTDRLPFFNLVIWCHEYAENYSPRLELYIDGEKADTTDRSNSNLRVALAFAHGYMEGWTVRCCFEEKTTLEYVIKSQDGEILLQQKILVTPAIYETSRTPDNVQNPDISTWITTNEGYMLEVLDAN